MTRSEENAIAEVQKAVSAFIDASVKLKEDTNDRISKLEKRIEVVHSPVYLEKDILSTAQQAIGKAISDVLTGYQSPLTKLILSVVDAHSMELRAIINAAFLSVIKTEDFKASIVQAFAHKVSRSIIANNDSLFDKVSNELKQDPQFKAKLTLAVAGVVEEILKQRQGAI